MSSLVTDPPPLPSFDNTLGALLIGALFAAAFWGVTTVQTYIYYQRYPQDVLLLKLLVAVLWVLDTFDVCLTSHIVYHYLVTNYMNPAAITKPVWSMIIHTTVTTITDSLVRCMFSRRVWGLSNRNMVLTSVVWVLSLCDLVVGLLITVKAFQLVSWTQLHLLAPLFYLSFVTAFVGDLYVSVVLCYYLFRSRTGLKRTDTLVNTLIIYTTTTGLLTSIDAILGTLMYAVMPHNFIFIAFYFNLAKLYTNSYLALLNARNRLRVCGPLSIRLSGLSSEPHFASAVTESTTPSSPDVTCKTTHQGLEVALHESIDQLKEDFSVRTV